MTKLQLRQKPPKLCARTVEFRAADPFTDGRTLEGYAAVFNEPTVIESFFGDFEEQVARGSFKRTLDAKTPVLQFDHGHDARTGSLPIGVINDIREDSHGLFVSARLFDNDVVEPIRQAIEAGAIDGMSFRFRIMREDWSDANGDRVSEDELIDLLLDGAGDRGPLRRTIREVELFELGPVVFPAYDATSVGVRSLLAQLDHDERAELVHKLAEQVDHEDDQDSEPPPNDDRDSGAAAGERGDDEASSEPADQGTSDSKTADPARGHSVYLREPADWYLPTPTGSSY